MMLAGSVNSDWYLGLTIGFVVVVVVVLVVAVILTYASKIVDQAVLANEGLEDVRAGTAPLWEVRKTNSAAAAILEAARTARTAVVATVTGEPMPAATLRSEPLPPEPGTPRPAAVAPTAANPPGVLGPDSYPNRGRGA